MRSIETKLLKMMFELTVKKYPNPERTHIERCRNKVIQLFQQKKYKDVLQVLDGCLSGKECNDEARLMKIQALGAMQEYGEAAKLITSWIIENPENNLWFEALHLLYFAGLDSHKVIESLLEVEKKSPENLLTSLYLADMYTRTAEYKEAIHYHTKALKVTDEADLKTSIYFQLGLLYYETKQYARMKTALEQGKNLGFDYAPLLNLLAYHYITKDNNLAAAEKLMETVLKESPNNPHYLDTQAMLFIKQGKNKEAIALLELIVKQEPDDAVIVKHLAKTYKKMGCNTQAVACLEHAVKLTYDTHKKQKYEQVLTEWKTGTHGKKSDAVLCRR
jgi:tetratricopeptide (TPR) repeat protein